MEQSSRKTLEQYRDAIQSNQISFPTPVPVFERQYRADIQWRAAELYLIHGWSLQRLASRYGLSRGRIWQMVRSWIDRAAALGYLQEIPPDPMLERGASGEKRTRSLSAEERFVLQ